MANSRVVGELDLDWRFVSALFVWFRNPTLSNCFFD